MSFTSDLNQIMLTYRSKEAHEAVKEVLNLVDIHFAKTLSEVKSKGIKSAAGAVSGEATSPISSIVEIILNYPEPLQASLQETAGAIYANIIGNIDASLKDLSDAQENGVSAEEHVLLLVDYHLPALLVKHPEAEADQLRRDLTSIVCITDALLTAHTQGMVDRLIETAKQEAHHGIN